MASLVSLRTGFAVLGGSCKESKRQRDNSRAPFAGICSPIECQRSCRINAKAGKTALRWHSKLHSNCAVIPTSNRRRVSIIRAATETEQSSGFPQEVDTIVVGAGLAGLCAARELQKASIPFLLLEASDGVGGRVRTDVVDGFLLDRGFQIFLTAYPECQKVLDYEALDLKPFYAGALVWLGSKFHRVADPFRHLLDGIASLPNPVGSVFDKVLVGLLRFKTLSKSLAQILSDPETTIEKRLREEGFTPQMTDRFFRPFLGGIFFDRKLTTTSRMLEFVLRMLALGANTVPAGGIGAIPAQIAATLPPGAIRLNSPVAIVHPGSAQGEKPSVVLQDGTRVTATRGVIVAAEGPAGETLLGNSLAASPSKQAPPRSTVCLYFAAPKASSPEAILFLNGTGKGIVNNMCFPSNVAPSYAPPGKALVSVSLIGQFTDQSDKELAIAVQRELSGWFSPSEVAKWQHLRTYRIPFAQPNQEPPTELVRNVRLGDGIYVCGDHRDSATFDGAMVSGRRAAVALVEDSVPITTEALVSSL